MVEYLPQLFRAIQENWTSSCLAEVINLVEELATTLHAEFKVSNLFPTPPPLFFPLYYCNYC